MNDPRVVALHYRIEHESSVDYSKAEPVDHEEEGFRIRIEEGRACFVMKDDHPTVDSALEVVNRSGSGNLNRGIGSVPNLKCSISVRGKTGLRRALRGLRQRTRGDDPTHLEVRGRNREAE